VSPILEYLPRQPSLFFYSRRSLFQELTAPFLPQYSIHNLGLVGHIEDIAVAKDQQGKKLGLRIIQALDFIAEKVGCYKSILDCSEANEGFYVKCGFRRAGLEMAHYYEGDKSKSQ